MSVISTYLGLLSRHISLKLKRESAEGTCIIQSTIHLDEKIGDIYLVNIGDTGTNLIRNEHEVFMVAFTEDDLDRAGKRFCEMQEQDLIPEISTVILKAAVDLEVEEDFYIEDRAITDEKLLEMYSCWDIFRLFIVSLMR